MKFAVLTGVRSMNEQYNSLFGKLGIALNYAVNRKGPMSTGPSPLGIFMRSDETKDRADLCFVILPFSRTGAGMQAEFHRHPGLTLSFYDCRPTSRGYIRLKSNDPATYPRLYRRNSGEPFYALGTALYGVFVQDQWRAAPRLTLNLGVRWDYEDGIGVARDRNNVAPRVAARSHREALP